jgi:hypothetical protein
MVSIKNIIWDVVFYEISEIKKAGKKNTTIDAMVADKGIRFIHPKTWGRDGMFHTRSENREFVTLSDSLSDI